MEVIDIRKDQMKVLVKCEECGKEYLINYKSYMKGYPHRCKQCIGKHSVANMHKALKEYFADPDNIKKHSEICKSVWENRSDEFKEKRLKLLKEEGDKYRNSIDFSKFNSEKMKLYYSDEENRKKASELKKKYWNGLTKEEKELQMLHLVEYWNNADIDKTDEWIKKLLDGMIKSNSIKQGPTESTFCDYLNKMMFETKRCDYSRQYRNEIIYEDFHKIFPENPATGGKYVAPYHIWDFIIHSESGNILIDIDGSMHNNPVSMVKYKDGKVDMAEIIRFNESKRKYQTDGLDAYAIHAYNNKLDDNTEVLRINDNSKLTYKELLSIIRNSQLNKAEIKVMMKAINE